MNWLSRTEYVYKDNGKNIEITQKQKIALEEDSGFLNKLQMGSLSLYQYKGDAYQWILTGQKHYSIDLFLCLFVFKHAL